MEKQKKKPIGTFFKQNAVALAIVLTGFCLSYLAVSGAFWSDPLSGASLTSDEVPHIGSGYYALTEGRYFLNPEHPPLSKDIAALPLLLLDLKHPEIVDSGSFGAIEDIDASKVTPEAFPRLLELNNGAGLYGSQLLYSVGNNADLIALLSRGAITLTNFALLLSLYLYVRRLAGSRTALLSLALITFSPFTLAHIPLVANDMMSALLQLLTLASYASYLSSLSRGESSRRGFWVSAIWLAAALLTKFSSIAVVPALGIGGAIYLVQTRGFRWSLKNYVWRLLALFAAAFAMVVLVYAFHVRNSQPSEIAMQIDRYYNLEFLPVWGASFLKSLASVNVLCRAMVEYFVGVCMVLWRLDTASQATYFLGTLYQAEGAGAWYFPVLYLTKLPIGLLVLNAGALGVGVYVFVKRKKAALAGLFSNSLLILLTSYLYLYAMIAIDQSLNIGLRHLLPFILAASVLTAYALVAGQQVRVWRLAPFTYATGLAVAGMLCASLLSFPGYLSTYNTFGGGRDTGYLIASDSNYDWGQDVKRLAKWVQVEAIDTLYTDLFSPADLDYYFDGHAVPYIIGESPDLLPGDYVAVSIYELQKNEFSSVLRFDQKYNSIAKRFVGRVGDTIFVFQVV